MKAKIRLGTRGSALALAQAQLVKVRLEAWMPETIIEVVPIVTTGDRYQKGRLAEIGGKGLFIKELEEALLAHTIDAAVHSMKDVETEVHKDFVFPALLPRSSPYDVVISKNHSKLANLPTGSIVGTASLRRSALLKHRYPHLKTQVLRGNIETRLQKLHKGIIDAIILAEAGLMRLGVTSLISEHLSSTFMVPSAGQGVIGIQCLADNINFIEAIKDMDDFLTSQAVYMERAFLEEVDGSCGTPVGAFAQIKEERIEFLCAVAEPEGKEIWQESLTAPINHAEAAIRQLGQQMHAWLFKRNIL